MRDPRLTLLFLCACSASSGPQPTEPTASPPVRAGVIGGDTDDDDRRIGWPPDDPTAPRFHKQGWYCHEARDDVDSIVLCHRTRVNCETARNQSSDDYQTSECRFRRQAACMLALDNHNGTELAICTDTESECNRHRMTLQSQPTAYKFISLCEVVE